MNSKPTRRLFTIETLYRSLLNIDRIRYEPQTVFKEIQVKAKTAVKYIDLWIESWNFLGNSWNQTRRSLWQVLYGLKVEQKRRQTHQFLSLADLENEMDRLHRSIFTVVNLLLYFCCCTLRPLFHFNSSSSSSKVYHKRFEWHPERNKKKSSLLYACAFLAVFRPVSSLCQHLLSHYNFVSSSFFWIFYVYIH